MALKSTVYKAELEIVDMDRHYYETHKLTLARHPSETDERMMIRLLAFALNGHERLEFGKGISDSDEPDLWLKDLTGAIELWIEVGHPDSRVLSKAAGRSGEVRVYAYSANPDRWWDPIAADAGGLRNLAVFCVDADSSRRLAGLARASMKLQCSVQDGEIYFRDDEGGEVQVSMVRIR